MDQSDITGLLQLAIALCTLVGILYGFFTWVWPIMKSAGKRIADFFRAIASIPQALDAIQSIKLIQQQVNVITKQVMPNGGSSMPDSMNRIEATLKSNADEAKAIGKTVNLMAATMRAESNTDPRKAKFEASPTGELTDANETYLRWTGLSMPRMVRWGWINSVHPDDRDAVRREWLQAISDVRTSAMKYRIVDEDGEIIHVEVTATPIPEGVTPCEKWIGVIYLAEGGCNVTTQITAA